ncbi:hypothetical protein BDY19DRAFT_909344 [Irpex rosettiformis]|uniref:Uncharacterized protein n=1 Tax=Irpex rosettiformis TaxID=378272 RepID=A0ACB8TSS3_9APHY|nr:hypothetical protein BDY19DRAFT_909344 [Irpex rosettiformis]
MSIASKYTLALVHPSTPVFIWDYKTNIKLEEVLYYRIREEGVLENAYSANSYHQQSPSSPSNPTTTTSQPQTVSPSSTLNQPEKPQQEPQGGTLGGTFQTLRLRDEQPIIIAQPSQPAASSSVVTTPRSGKKRKTPPTNTQAPTNSQDGPPQPPPPGMQHMPPGPPPPGVIAPHALMHSGPPPLPPHLGGPPPPIHAYQYVPAGDYTPGGMPPPGMVPPGQVQNGSPEPNQQGGQSGRQLSQSKRAEQNRKAQRAFRERRDQYLSGRVSLRLDYFNSLAIIPVFPPILTRLFLFRHVKALESRSQLLDAALASADEANRRWEDCRALVDQLRIENAALRAALNQLQQQQASAGVTIPLPVSIAGIGQSSSHSTGAQPPPLAGENGTDVPSSALGGQSADADDDVSAPPPIPADQTNQTNQDKERTEPTKEVSAG